MRISWMIILVIGLHALPVVYMINQCLSHQQSLLLAFKDDLLFYDSSTKIAGWSPSLDCCDWDGITCDRDGRVIGLDLSSQSIGGALNASSSLFRLQFLQSLNLAYNQFGLFPSGFGNLTHLTYLNLSNAYSEGQIPIDISLITRLVTLDLSSAFPDMFYLQSPDLRILIQNLTELRHLYLDNVNMLAHDWSGVISSSLPNLQALSLKSCNLSGSLEDSSLAKLKHLSVIILDGNTFSSGILESFADIQNLTVLSLSGCGLSGLLPYNIFQVPTLKTIDLSGNVVLEGPLPDSMGAVELQNLILSGTRVGGKLPGSIGSLKMLHRIEIRGCEFNGPIPESIQNLTRLEVLDLSVNQFTGSIPSLQSSKNHLVQVDFSQNKLSSGIPSSEWEGLDKLEYLSLANNSLTGSFPYSFLKLKSLEYLDLSYNSFSGKINDSINASSYQLRTIDLSSNKFEGPLPGFIFKLAAISTLTLSDNRFTGSLDLHKFAKLKELSGLDLSYNNLTITVEENSSLSSLSEINELKLASCKMQQIPNLKNISSLRIIDLSDNQLSGEIPNWIWEVGNGYLRQVNLSHNKFSRLQKPYTFPSLLDVLDLHSNNLEGDIPIPPRRVYILDYSNNNFRTSIPVDFGNVLTSTFFFSISISNNKVVGPIPQSICNASGLTVLDLSNNSLNGTLPSCLAENTKTLRVLNLRGNNLTGNVLDMFPESCDLQTLDLSANQLEGPLPQSLVKCKNLAVLDLGHNIITDTFPCWLNNLSSLHVFVIRSNRFRGNITCLGSNTLQIMDIASNRFSGPLPQTLFTSFHQIINNTQSNLNHLHFNHPAINTIYYQDSVRVVIKGTERELVKILNIFTSIDFSNNSFQGSIPATLGDLKLVKLVNLSHNALTGPLPASVGQLINLESLDLSVNKLSGSIPPQLASLSFLSLLNLSYNELSGRVPQGSQFQTFTDLSFKGNQGLCGMPLNKSCNINNATSEFPTETNGDARDLYASIGLGFVVGFWMIVGPLVFLRRWRTWYNNHVMNYFCGL